MLTKKLKNSLLIILVILTSSLSFAEEKAISFPKSWSGPVGRPYFKPHEDFLAIPFSYEAISKLREELESRFSIKLLHSEEAHLKVITPSEWRILKQQMTMDELEKLALKSSIMKMNIEPLCLSRVETLLKGKTNHSWVLLAKSSEVRHFRRDVWRYYLTKGGAAEDFQWKNWHPCITIGYSDSSYDEEMVLKDKNKCAIDITLTP